MSMTLAIAGITNCLLKRCSPAKRGSTTRCASRANAPVRLRIAVASGVTRAFWTLYKIRSTPSMRRCWNGWEASSIQMPLIWMRSTGSSNASHHLRWREASDNFADHNGWPDRSPELHQVGAGALHIVRVYVRAGVLQPHGVAPEKLLDIAGQGVTFNTTLQL